jgi:hypothetical protein
MPKGSGQGNGIASMPLGKELGIGWLQEQVLPSPGLDLSQRTSQQELKPLTKASTPLIEQRLVPKQGRDVLAPLRSPSLVRGEYEPHLTEKAAEIVAQNVLDRREAAVQHTSEGMLSDILAVIGPPLVGAAAIAAATQIPGAKEAVLWGGGAYSAHTLREAIRESGGSGYVTALERATRNALGPKPSPVPEVSASTEAPPSPAPPSSSGPPPPLVDTTPPPPRTTEPPPTPVLPRDIPFIPNPAPTDTSMLELIVGNAVRGAVSGAIGSLKGGGASAVSGGGAPLMSKRKRKKERQHIGKPSPTSRERIISSAAQT